MSADAVVVAARAGGLVDLEFAPPKHCGACAGTCLWRRLAASRLDGLKAPGPLAPGTAVSVSLPERFVLAGSLLLHGLPLAALLAGAATGTALAGGDLGAFAGAALALLAVVAVFGRLRRWLERATLAHLVVRPSVPSRE
jgi:positive regulator of sigma E activity